MLNALKGIGSKGNAIDTRVSNLTLVNNGDGDVSVANTGNLTIRSATNTGFNRTISVSTSGSMTQAGDILVNADKIGTRVSASGVSLNAGGNLSMAAGAKTVAGIGLVDYTANGTVTLNQILSVLNSPSSPSRIVVTSRNGNIHVSAIGLNPHTRADIIEFHAVKGNLGGPSVRPTVVSATDKVLINTRSSNDVIYLPHRPRVVIDNSFRLFALTETKSAITGAQQNEEDELEGLDPAIFTRVRNFGSDEIAVRLPEDQIYE